MKKSNIIEAVKAFGTYDKNKGYIISDRNLERMAEDLVEFNTKLNNVDLSSARLSLPDYQIDDGQHCLVNKELSIFTQAKSLKKASEMYGQAIGILIQKKLINEA